MPDLGAKIAFVAVQEGTPVYDSRARRIGVVEEVLADHQAGIFEGVLIQRDRGFVDGADAEARRPARRGATAWRSRG